MEMEASWMRTRGEGEAAADLAVPVDGGAEERSDVSAQL